MYFLQGKLIYAMEITAQAVSTSDLFGWEKIHIIIRENA